MKKIGIAIAAAVAALVTALTFTFSKDEKKPQQPVVSSVSGPARRDPLPTFFGEEPEGMGIRITKCQYDVWGVNLEFVAAFPPPYVVGIFLAEESGFASRICPIRIKTVNETKACLSGRFYDRGNVFVQVFSPTVTNHPCFHVLTENQQTAYYDSLREYALPKYGTITCNEYWNYKSDGENMRLAGDYRWVAFTETNSPSITLSFAGRGYSKWIDVTNTVQTAIVTHEGFYSNYTTGVISDHHCDIVTNYEYSHEMHRHLHKVSESKLAGQAWWSIYDVNPLGDIHNVEKHVKTNSLAGVTADKSFFRADLEGRSIRCKWKSYYDPGVDDYDAYLVNRPEDVEIKVGVPVEAHVFVNDTDTEVMTIVPTFVPHDIPPGNTGEYSKKMMEFTTQERTFGPFDTSSGLGYRITYHEDTDQIDICRAYSMFPDRSNEIVLCRPMRPISAHNGKKYALDWLGFERFVTETNAVQDRVYWEGL